MPVRCNWYDESSAIIIQHFVGDWTDGERAGAEKILAQLSYQVTKRFDIIFDFSEAAYTPPVGSLWTCTQEATWRDGKFPNWGLTVFVANNRVIEAYFEAGIQSAEAMRKHSRQTTTITEAIDLILTDRART